MVKLNVSGAMFGSHLDEMMLFRWIETLAEQGCVAFSDGVHIGLRSRRIKRECLLELIALFRRFDLDMRQLAVFESDKNRRWFRDPRKYWHSQVFGAA